MFVMQPLEVCHPSHMGGKSIYGAVKLSINHPSLQFTDTNISIHYRQRCLDNFLGNDIDVFSWDYSMNEAGGIADGLEAYIRQGLSMRRQPMLIVKDTSIHIAQERYDLIQR